MAIPLKYNSASQEIPLGQFLDSTDGNTEEGALTINNTDIKLWKAGATTVANKNSGGATHISNGIYYATLDATDTNTYGPLVIFVHVAGALAVRLECVVMEANAYDALYAALGTGHIEADLQKMGGVAQSATDLKDFADAGYDPATNKVEGVKLVDTTTANTDMRGTDGANTTTPPTAAAIADAVWDETSTGHGEAGKAGNILWNTIPAILADTNELQGNQGNWLTATGFSTHSVADILTTQMTEAYAADGTAPTFAQMQFMLWSALSEFAISGTTLTCKKLDGSTAAMTFTLDDATNPTSRTRAS